MKVKLFKDGKEAKIMQAICQKCWDKHQDFKIIFTVYNTPDCGKSWSCLCCGKSTLNLATRNCKVVEDD